MTAESLSTLIVLAVSAAMANDRILFSKLILQEGRCMLNSYQFNMDIIYYSSGLDGACYCVSFTVVSHVFFNYGERFPHPP